MREGPEAISSWASGFDVNRDRGCAVWSGRVSSGFRLFISNSAAQPGFARCPRQANQCHRDGRDLRTCCGPVAGRPMEKTAGGRSGLGRKDCLYPATSMIDSLRDVAREIEAGGHRRRMQLDGEPYAWYTLQTAFDGDERDKLTTLGTPLVALAKESMWLFASSRTRTRLGISACRIDHRRAGNQAHGP